jgi:hypothetical protein
MIAARHAGQKESKTAPRDVPPGDWGADGDSGDLVVRVQELERRLRKRDEQRRAMIHIMGELNSSNKRLADQRKAMLHILADYEEDRRRLGRQTDRLDNSRRALLHILQDVNQTNRRL